MRVCLPSFILAGWAWTCAAQSVTHIKFQNGASPALNCSRYEILPAMGQKVGGNLFHSFSEFSVGAGHSAVFKTPADVSNILARVTGGAASNIDGTLRTELELSGGLSDANLYLINPAGILFGPNAKLEVGGSFTATTADYVKLGDGGRFDARQAANDVLTTAPVSAFGFLGPQPASSLTVRGSQLAAAPGREIALVGGDFTMEGGRLGGPDSRVSIFSTRSAGDYDLRTRSTAPFAELGAVTLQGGAAIDTSGPAGGLVRIQGGNFTAASSAIHSDTQGGGAGEGVAIESRGTADFNATTVSTRATATSMAGARGGALQITAGSIRAGGFSTLSASVFGAGAAGSVQLAAAESVVLEEEAGAFANSDRTATAAGGTVSVQAKSLVLRTGGLLEANTSGVADAGAIEIASDRIILSNASRVSAGSEAGSRGNSGSIVIHTNDLQVLTDAQIAADTFGAGAGAGGMIRIDRLEASRPSSIVVDGREDTRNPGFSAITARSAAGAVNARRGGIQLETDALTVANVGFITTSSFGDGEPGDLTVLARDIFVNDSGFILTRSEGSRTAGRIVMRAENLRVEGLAQIDASVYQGGNLPSLGIDIQLMGRLQMNGGQIQAVAFGGQGASISVAAPALVLDNGHITTEARRQGRGGVLTLRATEALSLTNRATLMAGSNGIDGVGGAIHLDAPEITISGRGTSIDASSPNEGGSAGQIEIRGGNFRLLEEASLTSRSATDSRSGTIDVRVGNFYGLRSEITSSNREGGFLPAGNIRLSARQTLTLESCELISETYNTGPGGSITLRGRDVLLRDTSLESGTFTGTTDDPDKLRGGTAGALLLHADRRLLLAGSTQLIARTYGSGNAGNIRLSGGTVRFSEVGGVAPSVVSSTLGPGRSGRIVIDAAGEVNLGRGSINTSTSEGTFSYAQPAASGASGDVLILGRRLVLAGMQVNVTSVSTGGRGTLGTGSIFLGGHLGSPADEIAISDHASLRTSRSNSSRLDPALGGRSGDIALMGGRISIRDSLLEATSKRAVFGGTISLRGGEVEIARSSLAAEAINGPANGRGGAVVIEAGQLALHAGASLSAATAGAAQGGDVAIRLTGDLIARNASISADTLMSLIDRSPGRSIATPVAQPTGNGGNVNIRATNVTLLNATTISASTGSAGRGGDVMISTGAALQVAEGSSIAALSSRTADGGAGGNVRLTGASLLIDMAAVTADSRSLAPGGSVQITAGQLDLRHGTIAVRGTLGDAGSIAIQADALRLRDSDVTASAGRSGGNISIAAGSLSLTGSRITADAFSANGGQLDFQIASDGYFGDANGFVLASPFVTQSSDSVISASSAFGLPGSLLIAAPFVDLAGSLEALHLTLPDASTQLRDQCVRKLQRDFSSYLRLGRGGQAEQPDELGASY